MDNYSQLARIIAERRKFLGIRQEDLAEIAGISLRTLKSIETGKCNPGIMMIIKVLDPLGLELKTVVK